MLARDKIGLMKLRCLSRDVVFLCCWLKDSWVKCNEPVHGRCFLFWKLQCLGLVDSKTSKHWTSKKENFDNVLHRRWVYIVYIAKFLWVKNASHIDDATFRPLNFVFFVWNSTDFSPSYSCPSAAKGWNSNFWHCFLTDSFAWRFYTHRVDMSIFVWNRRVVEDVSTSASPKKSTTRFLMQRDTLLPRGVQFVPMAVNKNSSQKKKQKETIFNEWIKRKTVLVGCGPFPVTVANKGL